MEKKRLYFRGKYFKRFLFITYVAKLSGLERVSTRGLHKQQRATFISSDGTNCTTGRQKPLDNK
jgi:hypothetical protein